MSHLPLSLSLWARALCVDRVASVIIGYYAVTVEDLYVLAEVHRELTKPVLQQGNLNHVGAFNLRRLLADDKHAMPYEGFLQALRRSKAVLSGSFALQCITGDFYDNSDMDIYIQDAPSEAGSQPSNLQALAQFLANHNYNEVEAPVIPEDGTAAGPNAEYTSNAIFQQTFTQVSSFRHTGTSRMVQIIRVREDVDLVNVHSTFDITVCQVSFQARIDLHNEGALFPSFHCGYVSDVVTKTLRISPSFIQKIEGLYHLFQAQYARFHPDGPRCQGLVCQQHKDAIAKELEEYLASVPDGIPGWEMWDHPTVVNIIPKVERRVQKYVGRGFLFDDFLPLPSIMKYHEQPKQWLDTQRARVSNHGRSNCLHYLAAATADVPYHAMRDLLECTKVMIEANSKMLLCEDYCGATPISIAAYHGNIAMVLKMVKAQPSLAFRTMPCKIVNWKRDETIEVGDLLEILENNFRPQALTLEDTIVEMKTKDEVCKFINKVRSRIASS